MTAEKNTANSNSSGYMFGVDRGGTFTDIVAWLPDGQLVSTKVLSNQEGVHQDAAIIGIRRILQENGADLTEDAPIEAVRMGTTVGTNALLEHTGEAVALLVTTGCRDVLHIGYQNRPRLFDLNIVLPNDLYDTVIEVDERIGVDGEVIQPLNLDAVRTQLKELRSKGYRSCAVAFMHSYRYPDHEKAVAAMAYELGFDHVAMSHDCSGLIKYVARADTAVVDANLTPLLRNYVGGLQQSLGDVPLKFMQSNGGLIDANDFRGKDCVLSGPAGGIVDAVDICRSAGFNRIIGFDMGGTSTDVTHYAGEFERNPETEIAGVRIRVPAMAIHTVAAGGGSILSENGGAKVVHGSGGISLLRAA
ncbi:MAG: hypothetical protein KDK28_00305 [Maritimibacter sp.]|nr:hypothetical protein [Maritimibacter sp.]